MTSKKTQESGNFFKKCFPCFGNSHIDSDEINRQCFGDEFTEYEYVIENLAIRKAPKALLDVWEAPIKGTFKSVQTEKYLHKDQDILKKKRLKNLVVNPVLTDSGTLHQGTRTFSSNQKRPDDKKLNPCCLHLFPNKATCPECKKMDKSISGKDILRKMLMPPTTINFVRPTRTFQIYQETYTESESNVQKENVIVHQQPIPRAVPPTSIPADLEETIRALKKARPQRSTVISKTQNLSHSTSNIFASHKTDEKDKTAFSWPDLEDKNFLELLEMAKKSTSPKNTDGTPKRPLIRIQN